MNVPKDEPNEPRRRRPRQLTPVTKALYNAGSSPSEVARRAGVTTATVTKVMKGHSRSANVESVLASILGQSWDQIGAA